MQIDADVFASHTSHNREGVPFCDFSCAAPSALLRTNSCSRPDGRAYLKPALRAFEGDSAGDPNSAGDSNGAGYKPISHHGIQDVSSASDSLTAPGTTEASSKRYGRMWMSKGGFIQNHRARSSIHMKARRSVFNVRMRSTTELSGGREVPGRLQRLVRRPATVETPQVSKSLRSSHSELGPFVVADHRVVRSMGTDKFHLFGIDL